MRGEHAFPSVEASCLVFLLECIEVFAFSVFAVSDCSCYFSLVFVLDVPFEVDNVR